MKKKLLMLIGGAFLSSVLLVGCNLNKKPDNPPPPKVNTPDVNKNIKQKDNNDDGVNDNDNKDMVPGNDNQNTKHYPEKEDKNTPNDGDITKDNNTKPEDIIEDKNDMKDKDNKDE